MATTSFVYHAFGLRGYKHESTEYVGGALYHHVRRKRYERRCRHCSGKGVELKLLRPFERRFQAPSLGLRQQFVVLHGYRQHCTRCGC